MASGSPLTARISFVTSMATAIVRAYVHAGFVIAADGRESDTASGKVLSEHKQKIFQIGSAPIAYTFMGTIKLHSALEGGHKTPLFDFSDEFSRLTQQYSISRAGSLSDYVGRICVPILANLRLACQQKEMEHIRSTASSNIFLDRYVGNRPERVKISFLYENGMPLEPDLRNEVPTVGPQMYGSELVAQKLADDRHFRLKYTEDASYASRLGPDLSNLIGQATTFINACSSVEADRIDPAMCPFIGGHMHLAVITPKDGFHWVIPPINAEAE